MVSPSSKRKSKFVRDRVMDRSRARVKEIKGMDLRHRLGHRLLAKAACGVDIPKKERGESPTMGRGTPAKVEPDQVPENSLEGNHLANPEELSKTEATAPSNPNRNPHPSH